jgi:DNA-directed RNA polymerase subunit K/omega
MADSHGFEVDVDDDEVFEETPEIEQPEFEEVFQGDTSELTGRLREGADRISKPILKKMAMARLISARAKQLEIGFPPVIPRERLRSGEEQEIALQEFEEQIKRPNEDIFKIRIRRNHPDGTYEIWRVNEFKYFPKDIGRTQRARQRKFVGK